MPSVIFWFWIPFAATCAYALLAGGRPERWAAALLIVAALTTLAVKPGVGRYLRADYAIVVVDLALFASLIVLSIRANRTWPIGLSVLQGITSLGHLAKSVNPEVGRMGYWLMLAPPEVIGLAVLAIGVWRHQRRLRKFGIDPSWKG